MPRSTSARLFCLSLVVSLPLLSGCTALLWKDHQWSTVHVFEVETSDGGSVTYVEEGEFNWGDTAGRIVLTPFALAADASVVALVSLLIYHDLHHHHWHDC